MHVERHIIPRLGAMKLRDLTGQRLREHYVYLGREGKMTGEGLGDASVRKVRAVIHAALADAVGDHLLPYNPADSMGGAPGGRASGNDQRASAHGAVNSYEPSSTASATTALYPLWYALSATVRGARGSARLKWDCLDLDQELLERAAHAVPRSWRGP